MIIIIIHHKQSCIIYNIYHFLNEFYVFLTVECIQQSNDVAEETIVEDNSTPIPTIAEDEATAPPKKFNTIAVQTDDTPLDEPHVEFSYFMCNRETFAFTSTAEVQVSLASKKPIEIDTHNKVRGFYGFSSIDGDEKLNFLSGVNFAVFNLLLKVLPKSKSMKISRENKLLIFLMKMKLGLTFASLSVIFDVHQTSISRTFLSVLDALHVGLEDFVRWPARHVVEHLLPDAFKKNYPKCRAIIDCSEIRIEHPSSIEQQVQTYSNYKSSQTVKFLIACTPDGFISFVSHCYGGRSSDSFITVDSGFLDLIEPGDVILADKGFPSIRTDVENKNAIFVMPPFAFNEQFTQDEMSTTYKIASVRIHIERCIQRVKLFRITHFLPHELVPHSDKIVRICCSLVNLQPPIIKS